MQNSNIKKNTSLLIIGVVILIITFFEIMGVNTANATSQSDDVIRISPANMSDDPFIDTSQTTSMFSLSIVRSSLLESIFTSHDGSGVTYRLNPSNLCNGATLQSMNISYNVGAVGLGTGSNSHPVFSAIYDTNSMNSMAPISVLNSSIPGGLNLVKTSSNQAALVSYSVDISSHAIYDGSNLNLGIMFLFEDEASIVADNITNLTINVSYDDTNCFASTTTASTTSTSQASTTTISTMLNKSSGSLAKTGVNDSSILLFSLGSISLGLSLAIFFRRKLLFCKY